ncbi:hypothetical protein ACF1A5_33030 [Streptomyces sp. NPDC014864]|uniref:hypothetical protein n=1 Tax=Streptomyces sp. NPDC014864 TaxID=3364924 RepID=UPI0036FB1353
MIDPSSIELDQFLTTWYGPPSRKEAVAPEQYRGLPSPLQAWHTLAARWSRPLIRNKKLLAPNEITTKDGKVLFMVDPGDAIWGFDPESPTTVYEGRLYGEWVPLSESFTEFLIHNAMNEATHAAPHTKSCESVKNEHIARIVAPMTEVNFGGWYWPRPGHRIFVGEGLIADIGPAMEDQEPWGDKPGYSEVQIGATTASNLSYLDDIPETDWY